MKELLKQLKIHANDVSLYVKALTHSSYANEYQTEKNEKLEFLGDAVIELLMSDYLYSLDMADEGELTKSRAQAVCEEALVIYAEKINLKKYIKLGKGESIKGANSSMIADAFEALFGATFLDLGFNKAESLFKRIVIPYLKHVWVIKDYKSTLQELIQGGDKRNISYHIISQKGPSHHRFFEAAVKLDQHIILGTGSGRTKKEAEQHAAKNALEKGNYHAEETI